MITQTEVFLLHFDVGYKTRSVKNAQREGQKNLCLLLFLERNSYYVHFVIRPPDEIDLLQDSKGNHAVSGNLLLIVCISPEPTYRSDRSTDQNLTNWLRNGTSSFFVHLKSMPFPTTCGNLEGRNVFLGSAFRDKNVLHS